MNNEERLKLGNYCVSFIDLLGQRLEYQNEGLLPKFDSDEEKANFINKLKNTIGRINDLQRASNTFLKAALGYRSPERELLPPDQQRLYDETKEVYFKQQRWSDGLFYFAPLMEGKAKCPIGGVYTMLVSTGSLCFLGLAKKMPLRGSIDIAWATEFHEGELYGAAVAKAYELENYVAQYPRIVVGPRVIDYLTDNMNNSVPDIYGQYNRAVAKTCYDMLSLDSDGYHFVHYLGDVFHKIVTRDLHQQLYQESMNFILEQRKKWGQERNTKLAFRYNHLMSYFLGYPLSKSQAENMKPSA